MPPSLVWGLVTGGLAALFSVGLVYEVWAVLNSRKGDTLTEQVEGFTLGWRRVWIATAGALSTFWAWVVWHWITGGCLPFCIFGGG